MVTKILKTILLSIVINQNVISHSFAGEHLLDIYQLALQSDPDLKQVELSYDIAVEMKKQDLSPLLPNIRMSGNITNNAQKRTYEVSQFDGEEDYNSQGYSLTLTQSLFRYENNIRYKQADQRIKQTNVELEHAKQSLMIQVAERYFDILAAQDNLRFVAAEKHTIQRQLEQVKNRLEAGLSAITDLYETQARLDSTIALEIEAQNKHQNSLEALRKITNQYHENLAPLNEIQTLTAPVPLNITHWESVALKNNLEIIALRYNNERLRQDIKKQRAGHYPTLDLILKYSKSNSGGGNFGDSETEDRTVGLQLEIPIYQGGLINSKTQTATQTFNQHQKKLESTIRNVRTQTRKAYLGVMASIARIRALKQAVHSNKQAIEAIQAGYNEGMRTTFDVLQANKELYRTQRDYQRARYDYILNNLKLKQATGHLLLSNLKQVNMWLDDN